MIVLGLTGSIGMGKSTTAAMFADEGALIWNADDAVHRLYAQGGAAVAPLGKVFPDAIVNGAVDRDRLSAALNRDASAFALLEGLVHPLVAHERRRTLEVARQQGAPLAVLDIPLLFETGGDAAVDAVVVVTAPAEQQASRVLSRPGMTRQRFEALLSRQLPDPEKRRRADFIVDTGQGLASARRQVKQIVGTVLSPHWIAPRSQLPSSLD